MISLCSRLGLVHNLVRIPDFKIQRALLDTQFQRIRREVEERQSPDNLLGLLEREYQQFTESVNQWKALQAERHERVVAVLEGAIGQNSACMPREQAMHSKLRTLGMP